MSRFSLILSLVCVVLVSSCTDSDIRVEVPNLSTGVQLIGNGVELDPHFFSQNLTRNDGATEEDWYDIIVPRIKAMDIQRFRVMLQPHWWEPYNDNDDPFVLDTAKLTLDSPEVNSVCKVLDVAQELGASVTLVLWGSPISARSINPEIGYIGRHFLADPDGTSWVTLCADETEFAENFVTFVDWLINEKGYTCVREITPYNEPDGNISPLDRYYKVCEALDARLRREGLREQVKLNLSDNTDCRRWWLRGCAANLEEEADLFNSHTYIFGYDDPNRKALNWERRNMKLAQKAGKKHFVGEFGSDLCRGASRQLDINWYERGVLIVRNAINFLNAGAAGFSYWGLLDQYYGAWEDYAQMQQLGLWRYKECAYEPGDLAEGIEGDYAVRPQYYAYSLLTRFIRKYSWAYPLDMKNQYVAGTAVMGEDNKWTYVFSNATKEDRSYEICNPWNSSKGDCDMYIYSRETLPEDDSMLQPVSVVSLQDDVYKIHLAAESVILLKQR